MFPVHKLDKTKIFVWLIVFHVLKAHRSILLQSQCLRAVLGSVAGFVKHPVEREGGGEEFLLIRRKNLDVVIQRWFHQTV